MGIRHFASAFGGKDKHRANTPIHVDLVIAQRGTGIVTQIVERLFVLHQMQRDGL